MSPAIPLDAPTPPSKQEQDDLAFLNEVSLGVVRMLLAVNCSRALRGAQLATYVDLAAQVDEERAMAPSHRTG